MNLELTEKESKAVLLALEMAIEELEYEEFYNADRNDMMAVEERLRKQQIEEK